MSREQMTEADIAAARTWLVRVIVISLIAVVGLFYFAFVTAAGVTP